jgi:hypothetical protein
MTNQNEKPAAGYRAWHFFLIWLNGASGGFRSNAFKAIEPCSTL